MARPHDSHHQYWDQRTLEDGHPVASEAAVL